MFVYTHKCMFEIDQNNLYFVQHQLQQVLYTAVVNNKWNIETDGSTLNSYIEI